MLGKAIGSLILRGSHSPSYGLAQSEKVIQSPSSEMTAMVHCIWLLKNPALSHWEGEGVEKSSALSKLKVMTWSLFSFFWPVRAVVVKGKCQDMHVQDKDGPARSRSSSSYVQPHSFYIKSSSHAENSSQWEWIEPQGACAGWRGPSKGTF